MDAASREPTMRRVKSKWRCLGAGCIVGMVICVACVVGVAVIIIGLSLLSPGMGYQRREELDASAEVVVQSDGVLSYAQM